MAMIEITRIEPEDDLESLIKQINGAVWDADNDMPPYDVKSLQLYLQREDTVFIAAHATGDGAAMLLGIASGRIETKPYAGERWLYVDEVDVRADQRQKGAGKALMREFLKIAKEANCEELWLGTEVDNDPANALYQSLDPDEVEQFVGYTYSMDDE